jgi:hypothetical protein
MGCLPILPSPSRLCLAIGWSWAQWRPASAAQETYQPACLPSPYKPTVCLPALSPGTFTFQSACQSSLQMPQHSGRCACPAPQTSTFQTNRGFRMLPVLLLDTSTFQPAAEWLLVLSSSLVEDAACPLTRHLYIPACC